MAVQLIGANIAPLATLSMDTPDLAYPASNGNNKKPWDPMRSTTTSVVITITFAIAKTLQALSIHMHNLEGATVTLTNTAGFSQVIAIPARTSRGRCVDAWLDMRAPLLTTAAVWTLTITGALANISIGELVAVETLSDLLFGGNDAVEQGEHEGLDIIPTTYGVKHKFEYETRARFARGRVMDDSDRALVYALWQIVAGMVDPFLFIQDVTQNDPWLAEFDEATIRWARMTPLMTPMTIGLTEVGAGLVP